MFNLNKKISRSSSNINAPLTTKCNSINSRLHHKHNIAPPKPGIFILILNSPEDLLRLILSPHTLSLKLHQGGLGSFLFQHEKVVEFMRRRCEEIFEPDATWFCWGDDRFIYFWFLVWNFIRNGRVMYGSVLEGGLWPRQWDLLQIAHALQQNTDGVSVEKSAPWWQRVDERTAKDFNKWSEQCGTVRWKWNCILQSWQLIITFVAVLLLFTFSEVVKNFIWNYKHKSVCQKPFIFKFRVTFRFL